MRDEEGPGEMPRAERTRRLLGGNIQVMSGSSHVGGGDGHPRTRTWCGRSRLYEPLRSGAAECGLALRNHSATLPHNS